MIVRLLFFCLTITSIVSAQQGSKEKIYSSFSVINDGLENTREKLAEQLNKQYFYLIKSKGKDTAIVNLADSIRNKSNELISYVNNIKLLLIIKTEKLEKAAVIKGDTIIKLDNLTHFDDYFTPAEVLLGKDKWNPIKGKYTAVELEDNISTYVTYINKNITPNSAYIALKNNYYQSWKETVFFDKPLAGIITYLSKLQVDILLTEQQAIVYLQQKEDE